MLPAGKKAIRSRVRNKRKEEIPRRKLIRNRPIKRKARSVERHVKRRRHNYNLRSASIEFVSETPCCLHEETRNKYASLGLDSALFHCRSRPARRKQSHISIVTISSSDDEESMARTAEWVASVAIENKNIPCPEESFNMDLDPPHNTNGAGGEAEEIRQQLSLLQFPTTQKGSNTFQCSTSSASTSGKYLRSTCPESVEVGPLDSSLPVKHRISGVTDSVMSGLFHPRSSEIYQSPTLQGHREFLPLTTKISDIVLPSKTAGKTCIFGPSIQECSSTTSSKVEKQIASTSEVRRPFCLVTPSQISTTIGSDQRRSFCTITPESHSTITPLGSEVKRHFYFSTPEKYQGSSLEERNKFCLITPTREQVSQEYRPLCSSTPESHQNIARLVIEKSNTFSNITLEQKKESKLINPQGKRSCLFSNIETMEVQDSPGVVLETPSNSMQRSIFQNPFNSSQNIINNPRSSHSLTHSSIQKEKNESETENKRQFYFGSLKTKDPIEHLCPSEVEENRLVQENNSMSSYECSISGIERISKGNPESPQRSMTPESSVQRNESSRHSTDDHSLLNYLRNDCSQNDDIDSD